MMRGQKKNGEKHAAWVFLSSHPLPDLHTEKPLPDCGVPTSSVMGRQPPKSVSFAWLEEVIFPVGGQPHDGDDGGGWLGDDGGMTYQWQPKTKKQIHGFVLRSIDLYMTLYVSVVKKAISSPKNTLNLTFFADCSRSIWWVFSSGEEKFRWGVEARKYLLTCVRHSHWNSTSLILHTVDLKSSLYKYLWILNWWISMDIYGILQQWLFRLAGITQLLTKGQPSSTHQGDPRTQTAPATTFSGFKSLYTKPRLLWGETAETVRRRDHGRKVRFQNCSYKQLQCQKPV